MPEVVERTGAEHVAEGLPRRHFGEPFDLLTPAAPLESTPRAGLYQFEWLAVAVTIVGIGALPWLPINPGKLALDRILQALSIAFLNVLALRASLPVWNWWRSRHVPGPGLIARLRTAYSPSYIALVVRAALAIQVTLLWFCCLKYVIPYFRPGLTDAALWRWDCILHGDISPSGLAVWFATAAPTAARWIDWLYVGYFPILLLFFAYIMIQERRAGLREPFVLGYCLFWVLGGASYYVMPSMGPIYHQPALFADVMRDMPFAAALNRELLADYRAFVAAPWQHEPMLYYGIAAMPSLHVGACAMFACFARHFSRVAFLVMVTLTAMMFVGSVVTGWHYAVDGYAGALLGWAAYRIAMLWISRRSYGALHDNRRAGAKPIRTHL